MGLNKRRRGNTKISPKDNYIQFPFKVINGIAYKELNHAAKGLLPQMYGKARYRHNNPDTYEFVFEFSYREAKRFGYSSSTFYKTITELREMGFIDRVRQGGSHGEYKATSLFQLAKRWELFGTDKFVESDQEVLNDYAQKRPVYG